MNRRKIFHERAVRLRSKVGVVSMISGERCSKKKTCDMMLCKSAKGMCGSFVYCISVMETR